MKQTVDVECRSYGATGLYRGFAEPEGIAVVCLECNGTGRKQLVYTPFIKRKGKHGVKTVHHSRGSFIGTGIGPTSTHVTYEEFQQGKMP